MDDLTRQISENLKIPYPEVLPSSLPMHILFVSPRQCWPTVQRSQAPRIPPLKSPRLASPPALRLLLRPESSRAHPGRPPLLRKPSPPSRPCALTPKASSIRGLLGSDPAPPVLNYTSPEMEACPIRKIASSAPFDLVHLDSIHLALYEPLLRTLLPRARIVYDWHNIESDLMRQYASHAPAAGRRMYAAITARKLAALELRTLPHLRLRTHRVQCAGAGSSRPTRPRRAH